MSTTTEPKHPCRYGDEKRDEESSPQRKAKRSVQYFGSAPVTA